MAKKATAEDVAKVAGVSKWTVIRAFTPGASIADASRRKVLAAAENMNYRPNLLARSLATNSTHQIAVFVDDFANPYKLEFLEALTAKLQSHGLLTVLVNINDHVDHVHALLNADQRQFDAVVLLGTAFRDETLDDARLRGGGPPLYVLARDSQVEAVTSISCATAGVMGDLCDHLRDRGRRRAAFLAGPATLSTALGRQASFETAWTQRTGAPVAAFSAARYGYADGCSAMRSFLASVDGAAMPDVLVCENDILACGAMDVLRFESGLTVPGDVSVVGFDDAEIASLPTYALTTIRQPIAEMVGALCAMLTGTRDPTPVQYPARLVVRTSS